VPHLELYGTGNYSLASLQKAIKREFGRRLAKGYLERLLENPFYAGSFIWEGKLYPGTQTPLISREQFEQVQAALVGRNKPKYRKHDFPFRGLLHCAYDGCLITAETKKENTPTIDARAHAGNVNCRICGKENSGIGWGRS
jgi:site-specific DNA recombinase